MKKTRAICFGLCLALLLLFPSCIFEQGDSSTGATPVPGGDMIPADAQKITITYPDYEENASNPEQKSYQADPQQFQEFHDFIASVEVVPLSQQDVLSFSDLSYEDAADLSVRFDTGQTLRIYGEGGVSLSEDAAAGNSGPAYYAVSQDSIYQLCKLLIPDFEKDYQTLSMDPQFVEIGGINEDKVEEIPFFMPEDRQIFPCSDGFLAFHTVGDGMDEDPFLRAVKYDEDGNFLWVQDYTDITLKPFRLNQCIQTKDGGFIFSVNGSAAFYQTETELTPGWLVKCDQKGKILWKKQLPFRGESEIDHICETKSGDILTAGTCQEDDGEHYRRGESNYSYTDLVFAKYDPDGTCISTKKYGGSDFDSFRSAFYSPDIGYVITGNTQSGDGDITKRKEQGDRLYPREFLTVLDDDLNEKWQYVFEDENQIYLSYIVVAGKRIYVTGPLSEDTGKHNQTAVFTFGPDGADMKSAIINASLVTGMAVSDNGLLISVNPFDPDTNDHSGAPQIYKLNTDLTVEAVIDDVSAKGFGYQVIPTADDGFFTIQSQIVKYLPQPLTMGRGIEDTATILSRFDDRGELLYRKVYDKNHMMENTDVVIPLPDGRVIIGR